MANSDGVPRRFRATSIIIAGAAALVVVPLLAITLASSASGEPDDNGHRDTYAYVDDLCERIDLSSVAGVTSVAGLISEEGTEGGGFGEKSCGYRLKDERVIGVLTVYIETLEDPADAGSFYNEMLESNLDDHRYGLYGDAEEVDGPWQDSRLFTKDRNPAFVLKLITLHGNAAARVIILLERGAAAVGDELPDVARLVAISLLEESAR